MIVSFIKSRLLATCSFIRITSVIIASITLLSSNVYSAQYNDVSHLANVNDIYQDSAGYIWLIGQHGLTRYDSSNQINFSSSQPQWRTPFTWGHGITAFNDKLMISTQVHGLFLFDPASGFSQKINIPNEFKTIYYATFYDGFIYFDFSNDLYRFNIHTEKTEIVAKDVKLSGIAKSENSLYFVNNSNIFTLNDNKLTSVYQGAITSHQALNQGIIFSDDKQIALFSDNKIRQTYPINSSIQSLALHSNRQSFFTLNEQGDIAHYSLEPNESTFKPIPHLYSAIGAIRVRELFHDNSNVLWIASNNGVQRLNESNVQNHQKLFDVKYNANELVLYKDELIVATYGDGFHTMAGASKYISASVNDSITADGKKIMSVIVKDNTIIWGAFDGVWRYKVGDNKAEKLAFHGNNNIVLKLVDKDGKLYIGTNEQGLKIYDWQQSKILAQIDNKDGLKHSEVIDLLPLDNGDIWLATANNVEIYNQYTKQLKQTGINISDKVISLNIFDNKVYAFTKGSGILIFNLQGDLLSLFAQGIDFGSNTLIHNEFWISSRPGVYRLEPEKLQLTLVSGTESYSAYGEPIFHQDKIYIWHYGGLLEVTHQNNQTTHVPITISKTTVSGQAYINKPEVNLDSASELVSFELASLDFRDSTGKQFQYRVNNKVWNDVIGNVITFTGLSSGEYDIEIRGTNSLGQWSERQAFAKISVAYPWYWTPKIRILYIVTLICIFALVAWLLYLRAQSIRSIYLLLKQELQTKGQRSLSTSRDLTLALNLLNENNINEAKNLLNQSLEQIKQHSNGEIPDSLYGRPLAVGLPYFADYINKKYHIKVHQEINFDVSTLDYELQANLYKIIYEAITCAILTCDGRQFDVSIREFKDKLWLTITDDQHSFSQFSSRITFNISMFTIRQITNQYQASLNTFSPTDTKGSQLVISFPMMLALDGKKE